jgi:hypothetical protein
MPSETAGTDDWNADHLLDRPCVILVIPSILVPFEWFQNHRNIGRSNLNRIDM